MCKVSRRKKRNEEENTKRGKGKRGRGIRRLRTNKRRGGAGEEQGRRWKWGNGRRWFKVKKNR